MHHGPEYQSYEKVDCLDPGYPEKLERWLHSVLKTFANNKSIELSRNNYVFLCLQNDSEKYRYTHTIEYYPKPKNDQERIHVKMICRVAYQGLPTIPFVLSFPKDSLLTAEGYTYHNGQFKAVSGLTPKNASNVTCTEIPKAHQRLIQNYIDACIAIRGLEQRG